MSTYGITKNFFSRGPYKVSKQKEEQHFKCEICQRKFAGKSGLWRHLKRRFDENEFTHSKLKGPFGNLTSLIEEITAFVKFIKFKLNSINNSNVDS